MHINKKAKERCFSNFLIAQVKVIYPKYYKRLWFFHIFMDKTNTKLEFLFIVPFTLRSWENCQFWLLSIHFEVKNRLKHINCVCQNIIVSLYSTWDIELCTQGKVAILHFYTKPFFFYIFFVLFLQPYSANWGILLSLEVFYFLRFYVSRLIVVCLITTYLHSLLLPWPMHKMGPN